MPGLKNSKPGSLIDFSVVNSRVFSQTDSAYDFYNKSTLVHGYVFQNMSADVSVDSSDAKIFWCGPCNEISLQPIGTVTPVVKGTLDGNTWVTVVSTTGTDGIMRISTRYRGIKIGTTGASSTPSLYLMSC